MNVTTTSRAVCVNRISMNRLNDKVFVWVLTKEEQSVVLEDEHALFPSDALITKVRMMGG